MSSLEAITKLNVLSSYETSEEKHKEYKECIHTILKDLEVLEQYKNIENELGIDLNTLFKALINGFYYKDDDYGILTTKLWTVGIDTEYIFEEDSNLFLKIKDYGKTWSLDKKTLIKENKYE